ncbi:MAG TPA: reverse transcriptase N-terminal domain-containing protein [Methanoculleus sp.]|uniref:reverse transcriptase N-terminal domain-containing protein n=1 Tax=Methanoculleus sp. TaxID=90427 RepID=UPI0025F24B50|nr:MULTISPECIES: reverse transcriptase N-terminal domain-containing protein [unclassified Methanoculleus]MCK9318243.1 reverse transcriptase N-terminal domain-containing protein [Methanoculleus sp.]MDD2254528.1 reverse transcriptase N-terminal domain-containing protein [Methanoculleus sp.]MDD2787436.1 reverse transcriptase N-terminal domain-containing protein [Methanoculleus sp.]MDD4472092.1 reverse transcriptase N-terminal domain-containing protein [Methanoculleus sp.]HNQ33973.1 reverse transc
MTTYDLLRRSHRKHIAALYAETKESRPLTPSHDDLGGDRESIVNGLQTRIAKATHEGKWNMVKRLRYLLTHTYSAKLLAVRIVTQNKGKRTPGVDGVLWTSASDKMRAALSLTDRQYHAKPLRRIYPPSIGFTTSSVQIPEKSRSFRVTSTHS